MHFIQCVVISAERLERAKKSQGWLVGAFPLKRLLCAWRRWLLEATGAPPPAAWEVARLGQLMTYRSLFVVASGQNACLRPAHLLSSRRNNRRKDDHGELRQVGPTCNKVG